MCQLRSGSYCSSILNRGTEDREEGTEGVSTKEALDWWDIDAFSFGVRLSMVAWSSRN